MLRTRVFELARERKISDGRIAREAGVSGPQIYRMKVGENKISAAFISASLRLFPDKTFDDLFYEEAETPAEPSAVGAES